MTGTHPYDSGLEKNEANFVALPPLSFIERSAGSIRTAPASSTDRGCRPGAAPMCVAAVLPGR